MRGFQLTVAIALWLAPASRCVRLHNALTTRHAWH